MVGEERCAAEAGGAPHGRALAEASLVTDPGRARCQTCPEMTQSWNLTLGMQNQFEKIRTHQPGQVRRNWPHASQPSESLSVSKQQLRDRAKEVGVGEGGEGRGGGRERGEDTAKGAQLSPDS